MSCGVLASLLDENPTQKILLRKYQFYLTEDNKKQSAHFTVDLDISCLSQAALMRCETADTSDAVTVPAFQGTISRHTVTGIDVMDQDKVTSPELQQGRISCRTVKADSHIACRAHAAPMPFPTMPYR